ncbi:MAG: peptidase domain-containing ABC transporter [Cyclobacteriaceae bacterium]
MVLKKHSERQHTIKKNFITQHDQSDCGVVCLANIISYHGGLSKLDKLREISGTNKQGTTLLGLYQAAAQIGFKAEGLQTDIEYLKKIDHPVILHVIIDNKYQHYLVIYSYDKGKFHVGDPGHGIKIMDEDNLQKIWRSNALLELKPITGKFAKRESHKNKMKIWFLDIIREDSTILITILITGIVVSVLGIAIAIFSQTLIDNLIPSGDIQRIILATSFVVLILLFKAFTGYFRQSFILRQSRDINIRMIGRFFSRLLRQPVSFFNNRHTGDMVARLNDTNKIQQTITYITGELLINALLLTVSLIAVFLYYPLAGIILACGMPVYYFIAYTYHPVILDKQKNTMKAHAGNESNYISTIENIDIIKTFNKEDNFAKLGKSVYGFFQQRIYDLGHTGIRINLFSEITGILLIMGVVSASIAAMMNQSMKPGEFIALLTLTNNIIPAGAALAFANIQLQSARVAFERIYDISAGDCEYQQEPDSRLRQINNFEKLELKSISFRYPGRKLLLNNVSLELKKGEIKTIFGENGTGKSTLLNIIQKFHIPESGEIKINTIDFSEYSIQSFRKILGVVPQQINLFNTTILENIVLDSAQEAAERTVKELERLNLLPFFRQFPNGLATIIEEHGLNISGGQKKLIGLARALSTKPQILLVDELTSSVDRNMENFFIGLFKNLKHQIPILQVTHNLKAASISDEILILENGNVTSRGTHQTLIQTDNIYSHSFRDYITTTA